MESLSPRANYRWGVVWLLTSLGCVLQVGGEYGRAATYVRKGLALGPQIGAQGLLVKALEAIAWLATAEGQVARAMQLGGEVEALREALGAALHPVLRGGHDQAVSAMRAVQGEEGFAAAWAEGRGLSLDEAINLPLEHVSATT
jgi:hypothetical protein